MIRSFRDAETERIWNGEQSRAFPANIQDRARAKMMLINQARSIEDLRQPPGNRLHRLSGDRAGQWSISVNVQYRLCFEFDEGNAYNLELTDYH